MFNLILPVLMLPAGQFSKDLIILCVSFGARARVFGKNWRKKKTAGQGAGCVQKLEEVSVHNTVHDIVTHFYFFASPVSFQP